MNKITKIIKINKNLESITKNLNIDNIDVIRSDLLNILNDEKDKIILNELIDIAKKTIINNKPINEKIILLNKIIKQINKKLINL